MVRVSIWSLSRIKSSGLKLVQLLARQLRGQLEVSMKPASRCTVRTIGLQMQGDITVIPSPGPLSSPPLWRGDSAPAAEGAASGTQSGKSDRILIVEDDLLVASQMEAALVDAGFEIAGIATTGRKPCGWRRRNLQPWW